MCQAYEAGGLKMVDVRSFLSALKIGWLKRILCDNWKITKIIQMFPLVQNIRKRCGKFASVIMQRVGNPFWEDVFKHY